MAPQRDLFKMKNVERIPINIWDDFYDDGFVPVGEKLETYIYVESSDIPLSKCKQVLEVFLEYISRNLNTEHIKLWIELFEPSKKYPNLVGKPEFKKLLDNRWEIRVEGLTHKRLDEWMEVLVTVEIKVDDIPFYIYSSS